jgi:YesN/AraC family two-component response regulator
MKYHVVAVDDEQIALDGLRSIEWEEFGFELAAALPSAAEALDWMSHNACDLLIADIRMPRSSGLELTARLRESQPDLVVVLLSGHSEFEYAREALRHGVFRYLLKPIDDEELAQMLADVRSVLDEREQRRHWTQKIVRDYWFRDHLRRPFDPEHYDEFSREYVPDAEVGPYRIVYAVGEGDLPKEPAYASSIYHSTYLRDHEWAWVVREPDAGAFDGPVPATVSRFGISEVREDLTDMRSALTEAQRAADRWFRKPGQRVYRYSPEPFDLDERVRTSFSDAASLSERISSMALSDPARDVRAFLCGLQEQPFASTIVRRLAYTVALGVQRLIVRFAGPTTDREVEELPDPFTLIEEATHLEEMIDRLPIAAQRAAEYVSHARERRVRDERLNAVLTFLDEHFRDPISLDDAAEVAGMHPARFSSWFKNVQGINYIDYLTRLRIETAKRKLREPDALVKDVAASAGFQDPRYFGQVFKKLVGITPGRYHALHVGAKTFNTAEKD